MPTNIIRNDDFVSKGIYRKDKEIARKQSTCHD